MKILILSNGRGGRERLSSDLPEPYLPVLNGPDGKPESMLGRLWRQLMTADLLEETSVVTCSEHVGELRKQLGANALIHIEPSARGSYPATMLAAAHLYTVAGVTPNETIIVLPIDFCVEGDFYHCVRSLPKLLRESESSIMMIGAKAVQPSARYDYIVPEQTDDSVEECGYDWKVRGYHANVSESEAAKWIASGALWNSGVYAFRLDFLLNRISESGLPVHYDELCKQYSQLQTQSLEEALIMDASIVKSCIRYDGPWDSLGSGQSSSLNRNMALTSNRSS
ncbi:hypothetical protein [Paenibacillus soyae]|uniref:Nucleotidyl transferase domain-containing protein n=1 Tax=Paenibacillus soyae TaxID=2969249 RepID=A0A9X2MUL0_9BACL|nr:hypothetical protein [Paenibacillus soyae]MCR2806133.1 hypothetical protein [Paenibacillus soyae]